MKSLIISLAFTISVGSISIIGVAYFCFKTGRENAKIRHDLYLYQDSVKVYRAALNDVINRNIK